MEAISALAVQAPGWATLSPATAACCVAVLLLVVSRSPLASIVAIAGMAAVSGGEPALQWAGVACGLIGGLVVDAILQSGSTVKSSDMMTPNTEHLLAAVRHAGAFVPPLPLQAAVASNTPAAEVKEAVAPAAAAAAAAAAAPTTEPVQAAVAIDESYKAFSLPVATDPDSGEHMWCDTAHSAVKVRGAQYLSDGVKIPASPSIFTAVHAEFFLSAVPVPHLAARPGGYLAAARARGDNRTYFIIVYNCPPKPYATLAVYFAAPPDAVRAHAPSARLWDQFLGGSDAWRNERLKLIPRIPECPWAVSWAVGNTRPVLLARRLAHEYFVSHEGGGYIELDCDVESSAWATRIVGAMRNNLSLIVFDLAFTLEGREEEELPEAILGAVRLRFMHLDRLPTLEL